MAVNSFVVDASEALRLMAEIEARRSVLVSEAQRETIAAGQRMQSTARELAVSRTMPHLAGSITARVKRSVSGVEVTIEAKDKLGYVREFGAGRSGPHPFAGPAAEQHMPGWEQSLAALLGRVL